MRTALATALFAFCLITLPIAAAGKEPVADSIALVTADPHYQGLVTFNITVDKKYDCVGRGGCARVQVLAYDVNDGSLIYGEAGDLDQARISGFLLGGGWSQWVERGGGPAHVVANLFRFDNSGPTQTYVTFATTSFEVAG
jgi:hypothetical protein